MMDRISYSLDFPFDFFPLELDKIPADGALATGHSRDQEKPRLPKASQPVGREAYLMYVDRPDGRRLWQAGF